MFLPENFMIFLNSASFAAALVFYQPGVCTHTRKARARNILKSSEKNTIFNEHPVAITENEFFNVTDTLIPDLFHFTVETNKRILAIINIYL